MATRKLPSFKIAGIRFNYIDIKKPINKVELDELTEFGPYTILIRDRKSRKFVVIKQHYRLERGLRKVQLGKAGATLVSLYGQDNIVDNVDVFWGEHERYNPPAYHVVTEDIRIALLGKWLNEKGEEQYLTRLAYRRWHYQDPWTAQDEERWPGVRKLILKRMQELDLNPIPESYK